MAPSKKPKISDPILDTSIGLELSVYESMKVEIVARGVQNSKDMGLHAVCVLIGSEFASRSHLGSRHVSVLTNGSDVLPPAYRQQIADAVKPNTDARRDLLIERMQTDLPVMVESILENEAATFLYGSIVDNNSLAADVTDVPFLFAIRARAYREVAFRKFEVNKMARSSSMSVSMDDFVQHLKYLPRPDESQSTYTKAIAIESAESYFDMCGLFTPVNGESFRSCRLRCALACEIYIIGNYNGAIREFMCTHLQTMLANYGVYLKYARDAFSSILGDMQKTIGSVHGFLNADTKVEYTFLEKMLLIVTEKYADMVERDEFVFTADHLNQETPIEGGGMDVQVYRALLVLAKTDFADWPVCDKLATQVLAHPNYPEVKELFLRCVISKYIQFSGIALPVRPNPRSPFVGGNPIMTDAMAMARARSRAHPPSSQEPPPPSREPPPSNQEHLLYPPVMRRDDNTAESNDDDSESVELNWLDYLEEASYALPRIKEVYDEWSKYDKDKLLQIENNGDVVLKIMKRLNKSRNEQEVKEILDWFETEFPEIAARVAEEAARVAAPGGAFRRGPAYHLGLLIFEQVSRPCALTPPTARRRSPA